MGRFEAVLFDAGGVLVLPAPADIGPVLAPFGGATAWAALHRAHYAGMRAQDVRPEGVGAWRAYRQGYVRAAGVPEARCDEAAEALGAIWGHDLWYDPLPDAVQVLRALGSAGVAIGVVSNAGGQIEAVLREQAVCQVGEGHGADVLVVVDSHVVGVSKPDPRIWAPALEVLQVPPERVLYVGDSVSNDVHGARSAGLHPLHLDPYDDHPDADHDRIRRLTEVEAWLG